MRRCAPRQPAVSVAERTTAGVWVPWLFEGKEMQLFMETGMHT